MNITINRTPFLRALSHAQSVVDRRATVPIYNNVLLSAADDVLTIRATDSDMEIVETVPCEVAQAGSTTLPAALIHGLVSKTAEGAQIRLEPTDNGRIRAKSGRTRVDIPCLPAADYPVMRMVGAGGGFDIDGGVLFGVIKRVGFLMATEVTRPQLIGIYFHVVDGKLRCVATDGVTLGRTDVPLPDGADGMPGTILPAKAVAQLAGILGDDAGLVSVEIGANLIRFAVGDVVLTSKMIDIAYPEYWRAIPAGNDKVVDLDRGALSSLLGRAALFTEGKNNTLVIHASDGEMTISAADMASGDFSETMEVFYGGDPLRIGLSCRRLASIVGAMDCDGLRMEIGETPAPPLISDPADASTVYLINPLRV